MSQNQIYYANNDHPDLVQAYRDAQESFPYFWRELYWDGRRQVPLIDMASVKVAFTQEYINDDSEPDVRVEHMWIGDIYYDGEFIYGELLNSPNLIDNLQEGEQVGVSLDQISDWMMVSEDCVYGAFTIQTLRNQMQDEQRAQHDLAWGVNFGDGQQIYVVLDQKKHPEYLIEHPMSLSMKGHFVDFITQNPLEVEYVDQYGMSFLHREVIAGNLTLVEVLLQNGADRNALSPSGKKPIDYAKALGWKHLYQVLGQ